MKLSPQHDQFKKWLLEFHDTGLCPAVKTIRIAGGWVRDTLLGTPPSDFDVVVEGCGGDLFGTSFVEWLNSDDARPIATVNILERNSDAYRHVKIAKVHIRAMKLRVDFTAARVSLQDYETLSPEELLREDARHRDLTINALYYNIHTEQVEDPLELSIEDLNGHLLRTPIPAIEALREDPVRIIRFARFYATLPDFAVHPDIKEAATSDEIMSLLKNKIPAGRVKCEATRLLDCKEAIKGLYFLSYCPGLLSYLSGMYPLDASQKEWVRRTQIDSVNSQSISSMSYLEMALTTP